MRTKRSRTVTPLPAPVASDPHAPPRLLTKRQVAEFLQMTTRTVEKYMAEGLPHYKWERRTRFDLVEVQEYLRTRHHVVNAA